MAEIGVIILAAGQGTRMKSELPKVLHRIGGKPLFLYVLETAKLLQPRRVAIVIGHGADAVRHAYSGAEVTWVTQEKQLGTGHAVLSAKQSFTDFSGDLLILSGDVPLISERTLRTMVKSHREEKAAMTVMTAVLAEPGGYGRILRDGEGAVRASVEEKDATAEQRRIQEVNAGAYVAQGDFLFRTLEQVKNDNRQGEYYLPDIVGIGVGEGRKIATVQVGDPREMLGINTREELARMEKTLRERINKRWMDAGVTLKDPDTTYIEDGVTIGRDTIIGPNTQLCGRTIVGERCQIDGSAYVMDSEIGNNVHLLFCVVLMSSRVEQGARIGPFAHLRPGTSLAENVHIGNFVETKEAKIGAGSKANHLTYLGDCTIGRDSNIGAGTITCNYDGFAKYKTQIGDRVQVGSDTTLVAPVALGDDVYVATASTVRHDVPAGALVYNERQEQVREGWTEQKRNKMRGTKK
ncbi:MAG TPA: bifunctional UDP-N-acetylglucosamine diphosphorylase/glucosamine-1-phosphate N-acetyltransferase GlmU [Candidatus Binatia bacterium]|jgi:bifunctional UDP-N-acetylglucosamine pyrophosphorylase/glucosamine-1-phosphate N-acetyltransferase